MKPEFLIHPLTPADRDWVNRSMVKEWGAVIVVSHGAVFHPADFPGYSATIGEAVAGLITYNILGDECEILTLNSWRENMGIGSALIKEVQRTAASAGCTRLYLITTNNNLHALRFYQKRGFVLSALRVNAIAKSRILKPQIPLFDENEISIRDEIELEMQVKKRESY